MLEELDDKYKILLNKYECELKEGKVYNKKGNDTKILIDSLINVEKSLDSLKIGNILEAKKQLLIMFEDLLKERAEI